MLGVPRRPRGPRDFARLWLGGSEHLWMWDYKAMRRELEKAGFAEIRRARFGDSPDPRFASVESPGRWQCALGIDCIRPHPATSSAHEHDLR